MPGSSGFSSLIQLRGLRPERFVTGAVGLATLAVAPWLLPKYWLSQLTFVMVYGIVGMAVACCGVLVFLSEKLLGGSWQATGGDLVLLFAASLFSYYTVAAKPLIERLGGYTTMAYATLFEIGRASCRERVSSPV